MIYKNTAKHLDIFKKAADKTIEKLGMSEWEVYYILHDTDDSIAACNADIRSRIATLFLSIKWDEQENTVAELTKAAKHEVGELLLWELNTLALARSATEADIESARHVVIHRIERLL